MRGCLTFDVHTNPLFQITKLLHLLDQQRYQFWFNHIENNDNNDTTQSLECLLLEIKFTIPI